MEKRIMGFLLTGLICVVSQQARAGGDACDCPIEAAMKNLPCIEYHVGAEKTTCPDAAAKLAKKEGVPVKFCLGRKTFESKADATLALAEQTETLVKQVATAAKCDVSGKITVGGASLECPEKAAARAKVIKEAINTVTVSYKVGDKRCDCPIEAKTLSAESQADIVFVVNGEETGCEVQHRLNMARAKYRAAVEALAKADK